MFQKVFTSLFFLGLICSSFLSSSVMGQTEELTQSPLLAENTTIVSEAEFSKLQKAFDPLKKANPAEVQPALNEAFSYYPVWYCVAQSYWTGNWYYWYSTDYNYSRYRALNACTFYNGNTCFVNCEIRY